MRALLNEYGPALSRLYGIHPRDYETLTPNQARAYVADVEAIAAAARG